MDRFLIGAVLIEWDGGGYSLMPGTYMEKFRTQAPFAAERITLRGRFEPLTPYVTQAPLMEQDFHELHVVNGERLLLYHWGYLRNAYGIWLDRIAQGREDVCSFDPAIVRQLPLSADWFFGVSGMQKALLGKGRLILHASYIDHQGQAILFTAPSQTGKSTQAQLWQTYAGAQVLNGDRVLLGKRDGRWHAYGYPNCGSSGICVDRTLPLRAIVVLEQGQENHVQPMGTMDKLRSIVSGSAVYRWDGEDVDRVVTLAEDLLTHVEIIKLICRPDEDAVRTLRNYLEEVRA